MDSPKSLLRHSTRMFNPNTSLLLKAVDKQSFEVIEDLLNNGGSVNGHGGSFNETPLHNAAQHGWSAGVRFLLVKGASPSAKNQFGQTPLHYAAASKSLESVRLLLEAKCRGILDHRDMRGHTPIHDAASSGCVDCIDLLIKAGAMIDVKDNNDETPLYKAAKKLSIPAILALLNEGANLHSCDKTNESVLSYILRNIPSGMESLFDHCLVPNTNKLSAKKLEVGFNFIPLCGNSPKHQMQCLRSLVNFGHPKLLQHSICEAYLQLQWMNIRRFFFIEVTFFFILAVLSTCFILDKFAYRAAMPETTMWAMCDSLYTVVECVVVTLAIILLIKQILTICQDFRMWILSLWHALNGIIGVLLLMVVPGCRTQWQHHLATITLLLIWVQCMLHIGRFPACGIYVAMFTKVAKVFLRIFLIFSCLLFAFSMAFYLAKYAENSYSSMSGCETTNHFNSSQNVSNSTSNSTDSDDFNTSTPAENPEDLSNGYNKETHKVIIRDTTYKNPIITFIKTLTMMIGELDFESGFVEQMNDLPFTSHIIYVAFVILVSIILSNLLVALAVNDVQGLRDCAHLERLIKQMELVFQMERTFVAFENISRWLKIERWHTRTKWLAYDFLTIKVFIKPYHHLKGTKLLVKEKEKEKVTELRVTREYVDNVVVTLRRREDYTQSKPCAKKTIQQSESVGARLALDGEQLQNAVREILREELRDSLKEFTDNLVRESMEREDKIVSLFENLDNRMNLMEQSVHKDILSRQQQSVKRRWANRSSTKADSIISQVPSFKTLQEEVDRSDEQSC